MFMFKASGLPIWPLEPDAPAPPDATAVSCCRFKCWLKCSSIWRRCLWAALGNTKPNTTIEASTTATPNGKGPGRLWPSGSGKYKLATSCSMAPAAPFVMDDNLSSMPSTSSLQGVPTSRDFSPDNDDFCDVGDTAPAVGPRVRTASSPWQRPRNNDVAVDDCPSVKVNSDTWGMKHNYSHKTDITYEKFSLIQDSKDCEDFLLKTFDIICLKSGKTGLEPSDLRFK